LPRTPRARPRNRTGAPPEAPRDLTDAQPLPQPAEQQEAADAPGLDTRAILTLSTQDYALPGKAPHGGQQAVQVARRENGNLTANF
jgi:hypothetical protein